MHHGTRLKSLLELNFKEGEKVKVSPVGDVIGLDGRGFKIDGTLLLATIVKNGIHIVLDENHHFSEAMGWFDKDSFEEREDGIYASLEWTPKGKVLAENKSYRYLSPVFDMGDSRTVMGLDSVGLVNRPNLLNQEINTKEEEILNELEKLKEENKTLKAELESLKKEENSTGELQLLKEQNEKILGEVASMKELVAKFGSATSLGQNDQSAKTLSENEKKVAKQLGLSDEAYLASKGV